MNLIGIHGPLGSGKDTVATIIQDIFPNLYERCAFAGPLKAGVRAMFNFSKEQMEDRVLKEQPDSFFGFTPRRAMQLLGTEYGRNMLRDDIWIKCAQKQITTNLMASRGTIITDVRFENEAQWFRDQDGILLYITAPHLNQEGLKFLHASENGITKHSSDVEILNLMNGLDQLKNEVVQKLLTKFTS